MKQSDEIQRLADDLISVLEQHDPSLEVALAALIGVIAAMVDEEPKYHHRTMVDTLHRGICEALAAFEKGRSEGVCDA